MLRYSYDPSGNMVSQAVANLLPPQIIGQPVQRIVEPGQAATFSVVVSDASGVTYIWKFNGTAIAGATSDSLLLTNVGGGNQGQYSVVVTNSAGSVTSAPAALMLRRNPTVNTSMPPQLVVYSDEGGSVIVTPMKPSYNLGETVTLTATPFMDSAFAGWVGDLNTIDNPATLTMDRNKTVRAKFVSAVPVPPGCVAFWRGETDASDLIGGHHGKFYAGSLVAPPSVTPFGKVGGAFSFDGTVHVRVPDSAALKPAQITVEAWVFPTLMISTFQTIIAHGSVWNDATWGLVVSTDGTPVFISKHVIHGRSELYSPSGIPLNEWTHLAMSFDGTTKRLHVNGVQIASEGEAGWGGLMYEPTAMPMTIGSDWAFNASSARFNGLVDEVAIYNRALMMNEVYDIYNADIEGKNVRQPYFTSPSQLPDAAVGVGYTQQLMTILGTAPIGFSVSRGTFPPGITLSSAGVVSGVPGVPGIFYFTVRATDSAGNFSEQLCVLRVQ